MIRSLALVSFLLATLPAFAQQARIDVARQPLPPQLRDRTPDTETQRTASPIADPSSPDAASEFGEQVVLVRQAQWEPWRADAGVSGFFTDNVALAPNRVHDYFMKYDLSVGYSNRISGPWSMDIALAQSWVRYDQFDSLDFDLVRGDAGIAYQADWLGDASFFLRYSFYRLAEAGFGSEIMHNNSLSVGLQKVWKVSQGQQVFFGVASEPSLETVPAIAQRHEHSLFGGWSVRLTDKLITQVSGRIGYHVSSATDREDWNYVALASVNYAVTDWAHVGVSSSLSWNESNKGIYTYRNVIAGVFVGVNLTF